MAFNTYYAKASVSGQGHAGTLSDPLSIIDVFGDKNQSTPYSSVIQRPAIIYVLKSDGGQVFSSSANYSPSAFDLANGESSFFFSGNHGSGPIVFVGAKQDGALITRTSSYLDYPVFGKIKIANSDGPVFFNNLLFKTTGRTLATDAVCHFVNCGFEITNDTWDGHALTSLSRSGSHTFFNGCWFFLTGNEFSKKCFVNILAGYFVFFGCWFDTFGVTIAEEGNSCFYDQCVFRQLSPKTPNKHYTAFNGVSSDDIKRCLFFNFNTAIQEGAYVFPENEGAPTSRNIIQNCTFYDCDTPINFCVAYLNSSLIFGNVMYHSNAQKQSDYITYMNQFFRDISLFNYVNPLFAIGADKVIRVYNGSGNPLGKNRPVMFMNIAWPFPSSYEDPEVPEPQEEDVPNHPDVGLAGISAYDLSSFTFPEYATRFGVEADRRNLNVSLKLSPNFLPTPIGTYPGSDVVIKGAVAYGAYNEMKGEYKEAPKEYVLASLKYGANSGHFSRTGSYIPKSITDFGCKSIHFEEPPES